jgi:hypothetical protein
MDQLKKDKSKHNRPDTPLAPTPEPVGMQQERERQAAESMKGSMKKLIEERRVKDNADKALKAAKENQSKNEMNNTGNALKGMKPSDF